MARFCVTKYSLVREDLVRRAFAELFDGREFTFIAELKYSGRFKGYNGNISLRGKHLSVGLSKQWKSISDDIQIGIIQHLLGRLFKSKKKTMEMDLYDSFIKNVHHIIPKTKTHPVLEASFNRINERFFSGLMERPNLELSNGMNRLGTYTYGTDTIAISRILLEDFELLDYVMYHEMLHKKHKFSEGRHHTPAFRRDEALYGDIPVLERSLERLIRKHKKKSVFSWWKS